MSSRKRFLISESYQSYFQPYRSSDFMLITFNFLKGQGHKPKIWLKVGWLDKIGLKYSIAAGY